MATTLPSPALHRRHFLGGLCAAIIVTPGVANAMPARAAGAAMRLHAAPGALRLRPEPDGMTPVLAFDGKVPGPLLRVRQGDELSVQLSNGLEEPLSLHWHGAGAPNTLDGVAGLTGPALAPGETRQISFLARHAGLFWYRPMRIGAVGRQTESGLYGALIVDEPEPPVVAREVLAVLDDWALADNAKLRPGFDTVAERAGPGRLGNWLTLNSAPPPEDISLAPGGRIRLRLLNAANARIFTLHFTGLGVHIIGIDGRPSEILSPTRDSLTLLPGARYDLIVEATAVPGAVEAKLGETGVPLVRITPTGAPDAKAGSAISVLPSSGLPDAIRLQDSIRAELALDGGAIPGDPASAARFTDPARIWTINGAAWPDAMGKPALSVRSGQPVTLSLKNATKWMQSLHIHGHHVRRLHNLDDGWEPYWLDVIGIPAGQTTRIAFVAGEPGKWLIGSSNAERLDGGMAIWFEVTP